MSDVNVIQTVIDGSIESLKRPAELLDEDLIPAKKPVEVDGELKMADDNKVIDVYQVPEKVVGLVIGKGGSEIRQIQQNAGCRVQMEPDNTAVNGFRNCVLEGTPAQVAMARQMITSVINRNNQPQGGGGGGGIPGEVTEDYLIPAEKCGLVIGKGGETIRTIQEQSGLRNCNIVQDSTAPTGQAKPLRMIGTPAAIETAKMLVNNIMANQQNNQQMGGQMRPNPQHFGGGGVHGGHGGYGMGNQGAQAKGEVIVPRLSAGMIIGKGGEMIKRLAQETGTKIQFKPDENPNSEDRVAVIIGTRDQIYRATERITEIVNRAIKNNGGGGGMSSSAPSSQPLPGQSVFFMHVPAAKCGLVIGKGGENIKHIERDSGAHCGLAQASEQKKDDEKVFEIRGTPQQIHHASHLVRIKVGEIAPNTPVPPMVGGNYQQQVPTFQPQNSGFQQQNAFVPQQPQQPQGQQYGIGQPWSGGVQHQHPHQEVFQQPQPAPQPQVDPIAPTVNPTTGAPDYSAQWAAYYRSIGLGEQAAMVESQMRRNQAAAAAAAPDQQQYYQQ